MILVDTSIWIEVFRKPPGLDLEAVVPFEDIVTCLPVIQEVLQGFRDEKALQIARESLFALPVFESPLRSERFLEAAQIYRLARMQGVTVRSSVDCLIAACALQNGLTVLHCDRDFSNLARVLPLKVREIPRVRPPDALS